MRGWGEVGEQMGCARKNNATKCEERRTAGGGRGKAEFRDAELWLRKLEGKGELHHLSRAKPRREAVLTFFF